LIGKKWSRIFISSERENLASTRAREEGNAYKREQKQYSYRHLDSPGRLAADFHVEKDNWVRHYVSKVFRVYVCCKKVKEAVEYKKRYIFPFGFVICSRRCSNKCCYYFERIAALFLARTRLCANALETPPPRCSNTSLSNTKKIFFPLLWSHLCMWILVRSCLSILLSLVCNDLTKSSASRCGIITARVCVFSFYGYTPRWMVVGKSLSSILLVIEAIKV
jgi:hypothetical protein